MENKEEKTGTICGVWGHVTPYPEGYGQKLWTEILMPELRKSAYPELMKQLEKERKKEKKKMMKAK